MGHWGSNDYLIDNKFEEDPSWVNEYVLCHLVGYPDPNVCWVWPRFKYGGYGRVRVAGTQRMVAVHRVVWKHFRGTIPKQYVLDHDGPMGCHNRACSNPKHLVHVTHLQNIMVENNILFQKTQQTHCIRGHKLGNENLIPSSSNGRACLTCKQDGAHQKYLLMVAAAEHLGLSFNRYRKLFGASKARAEGILRGVDITSGSV